MSGQSIPPLVLIDQPEDGICETFGWVEVTVTEEEARRYLAEFCCDEDGNSPYVPTGPARRVWLRVENPELHFEERWMPCEQREDATEFWEVVVE